MWLKTYRQEDDQDDDNENQQQTDHSSTCFTLILVRGGEFFSGGRGVLSDGCNVGFDIICEG